MRRPRRERVPPGAPPRVSRGLPKADDMLRRILWPRAGKGEVCRPLRGAKIPPLLWSPSPGLLRCHGGADSRHIQPAREVRCHTPGGCPGCTASTGGAVGQQRRESDAIKTPAAVEELPLEQTSPRRRRRASPRPPRRRSAGPVPFASMHLAAPRGRHFQTRVCHPAGLQGSSPPRTRLPDACTGGAFDR